MYRYQYTEKSFVVVFQGQGWEVAVAIFQTIDLHYLGIFLYIYI